MFEVDPGDSCSIGFFKDSLSKDNYASTTATHSDQLMIDP